MAKLLIQGGRRLDGDIDIECSKNTILPVLAASVLNAGETIISNYSNYSDVTSLTEILTSIGCKISISNRAITIDSSNLISTEIPDGLSAEMRSSVMFMGPMLARLGKVTIGYPGGCEIGPRPIDLHLKGLKQLGAVIEDTICGYVECKADNLVGTNIDLDFPSVGATENIMMCAVLAKGITCISNAAKEPEIVDLQNFLNKMGAKIHGAGSSKIFIEGVFKLNNVEYKVIPDRIVAGTYMCAAAMTGGNICLNNIIPEHLESVTSNLVKTGCDITVNRNNLIIKGPKKLMPIEVVRTLPYPGFPTDMQAQMVALLTMAEGTSIIIETIFESRYKHVDELIKMGANIRLDGRVAVIKGKNKLIGSDVNVRDLRGGASLILAGLVAEGKTCISDIEHIDRGYENIEKKLSLLGANISRY